MHDTSDLESRGIPTAYIATTQFITGADAQARALGFQHSPIYVEHPIQDRTDEEMRAIGDAAFEAVMGKIVQEN